MMTGYEQLAIPATAGMAHKRDPHPTVAWNHIGIQLLMPNYYEKFQKNTIPGLVLHGEDDVMQPVSYAKLVHEMIKNTKLVILPKVGHMFFNANAEKQIIAELLHHFKNDR